MPTYNALGITASLHTTDLQKTCASVVDFKNGEAQREDASRINDALKTASRLTEQPIENGVLQFVGKHEDIPLFAVRAGYQKASGSEHGAKSRRRDSDTSSSLSDLTDESILSARIRQPGNAASEPPTQPGSSVEPPNHSPGPQALILNVELCAKSFLPSKEGGSARGYGKDLKFEVFINGIRAAICFVPRRGNTSEYVDGKLRFCGTRVNRQIEVPWIHDVTCGEGKCAKDQWEAIGRALVDEARERGRNRWLDLPPSAEALSALSQLPLPQIVAEDHLGLVDLVITAGEGKKYGPEGGLLTGPERMIDPEYSIRHDIGPAMNVPAIDVLMADAQSAGPQPAGIFTSPEVPLAMQQKAVMPETPFKRRKTVELSSELDLSIIGTRSAVPSAGNQIPTLQQRLSDLGRIKDQNRQPASSDQLGTDLDKNMENVSPLPHKDQDVQDDVDMLDVGTTGSGTNTPSLADNSLGCSPHKRSTAASVADSPSRRAGNGLRGVETVSSTRKSTKTATRKAKAAQDRGWEDAVKCFEVPELCRGSVVSVGGQDTGYRQINKARNGEFREECVVVAMRFVVV